MRNFNFFLSFFLKIANGTFLQSSKNESLTREELCKDGDLYDECLGSCRLSYLDCLYICDSNICHSQCLDDFNKCEHSCPCGLNCPGGCDECDDHPLCLERCENAENENPEYITCLNNAMDEQNKCLKSCPPVTGCYENCCQSFRNEMLSCPCVVDKSYASTPSETYIMVILSNLEASYITSGDGSSIKKAVINAPSNNYASYGAFAVVKGRVYIFGGTSDRNKIARLDDCTFTELSARLNNPIDVYGAAATTQDDQVLICFSPSNGYNLCEIFDLTATETTSSSAYSHKMGQLGHYKGHPVTVGCYQNEHNKVEKYTLSGWEGLADHPRTYHGHSLVQIANGDLIMLGGVDNSNWNIVQDIWLLKNNSWSLIGNLNEPDDCHSSIFVGSSVYFFSGERGAHVNSRIDLDEDVIQQVEQIGAHSSWNCNPVIFATNSELCVAQ